ncbi:MAG TPA: PIN domain-containing protein [Usitatibacter sp.]|nr:PIN domain-containing protein [Usitatibacter sp.]
MSGAAEAFLDTNVLLYLLSADTRKAERAEEVVARGGVVSVQVLNEFASVTTRKLGMRIAEAIEALHAVRALCKVVALDVETHELGMRIAQRHRLSIYDAMIVASARLAGCKVILSEDMQDGQRLEGMRIRDPFRG